MKEQALFTIRMQLAALRQWLRDQSEEMSEEKKNIILDRIIQLTELLKELEK